MSTDDLFLELRVFNFFILERCFSVDLIFFVDEPKKRNFLLKTIEFFHDKIKTNYVL